MPGAQIVRQACAPWQEGVVVFLLDAGHGFKYVFEVVIGFESVLFGCFKDAVDYSTCFSTFGGAAE